MQEIWAYGGVIQAKKTDGILTSKHARTCVAYALVDSEMEDSKIEKDLQLFAYGQALSDFPLSEGFFEHSATISRVKIKNENR